jgi:hypothetical protein
LRLQVGHPRLQGRVLHLQGRKLGLLLRDDLQQLLDDCQRLVERPRAQVWRQGSHGPICRASSAQTHHIFYAGTKSDP